LSCSIIRASLNCLLHREIARTQIWREIQQQKWKEFTKSRKMSSWVDCNIKGSMEYSIKYRTQKREDTGIIFSHECYSM